MVNNHWRYYLSLEDELIDTMSYVEPNSDNFSTYSIAFTRFLLSTCSEVDVVCKLLCHDVDASQNPANINCYRSIITGEFPQFYETTVTIPRLGLTFQPWKSWTNKTSPSWWTSYNKVKHQRHDHFADATLENSLHAISGLFVLLLYYLGPNINNKAFRPAPRLLFIEGITPYGYAVGGTKLELPGGVRFPAE